MKAGQVDQALLKKFVDEDARLVFWHDPAAEFATYVHAGLGEGLEEVKVLDVAALGGLSAKLLLEREDPEGKYLVYTQGDAPTADEDWLLDIRLYSSVFRADLASLRLQELGLTSLSLREHLSARSAFLASKDRRKKLKRLVSPDDDEATLDLKMMAVLTNSPVAEAFDVLRGLCHSHLQDGEFSMNEVPELLVMLDKTGLLDRFWSLMKGEFGYAADAPTLAGLLRGLFISELIHQADGKGMESLTHLQLPTAKGRQNAVVFLTQWRDSSGKAGSYDAAANAIAQEQSIKGPLGSLDLDSISEIYTFLEAEKIVVSGLRDHLLAESQSLDVDYIRGVATDRLAGYWLTGPSEGDPEREALSDAYRAIVAAAELFTLRREYLQALKFNTPFELLDAYQKGLYRFDQCYRHFCVNSRAALNRGWDLLKALTDEVERAYDQAFIQPLGLEWSRHLDAGFLKEWSLDGIPSQQNFYRTTVEPHLKEPGGKRAYVIISDAFRYEAAQELTGSINGLYRMRAEISSMLGVLPSYTALGMASLLPHEELAYNAKGEVLADGKSTSGTEARGKQLLKVKGLACQAKILTAMTKTDARDFVEDSRVVYIYHNTIDAVGDSAPTESETFAAVAGCIQELKDLIQFCVNTLNAGKVWVTADHGFLFQQEAPGATDKSKLKHKPEQATKVKKRYVIGPSLGDADEAHHGSIESTSGAKGGMEFWVPRGANRFHFTGGARFVHGGAMPQEVVVPLVTVTHVRGKKKEASRAEKVSVQVLGNRHKITTPRHRFEIIQTEAVSERRLPITLRAAVYEGEQAVTSVETVTFDSASDSIEERKRSIRLELRAGEFDKSTNYQLVLRDADTGAEVQTVPVVIDRSFDDDF
tara:strand:+ start:2509 stop:5127 length:2619 start_codon:yes stop_codon:yes gene_type:complete